MRVIHDLVRRTWGIDRDGNRDAERTAAMPAAYGRDLPQQHKLGHRHLWMTWAAPPLGWPLCERGLLDV